MTQTGEQILQMLQAAREEYPDQAGWLDFHRELLLAHWAVEQVLPPLLQSVTPERVNGRQQARQPLFAYDELEVDWPLLRQLLGRVDEIANSYLPDRPAGTSSEILVLSPALSRVEGEANVTEGTVRSWYTHQALSGSHVYFAWAQHEAFFINQALRPFLHRAATAARSHLLPDEYWYWGNCPVCAGEPDFATLERESGSRRLFCSRCDTGWRFRRIGCPFCGTEDPRKLAYFPSDDGIYRLYVCDGCGGYVKTKDLRQTFRPFVLEVERVLTVGMDLEIVNCEL